jgi:hypothetical protein
LKTSFEIKLIDYRLFEIFKGNLFNLKFAAKELERSAKKCEKDSVNEKLKLKRVIK